MAPDALELTVAALPENLAVVRQAVAGYAEGIGFGEGPVANVKTVVTEACMNVVVHAYPEDERGPLEVSARPHDSGLEIVVRDHGAGFQPRPADPEEESLKLGLPLIAALSDEFEIRGEAGRGTEVRMRVGLGESANGERRTATTTEAQGTVMSIAAGRHVRPVLSRVIGALATRAEFSIDRLSDTVLLGDAVSAHDPSDFKSGTVGVEIMDGDGRLDVRIGPLVDGGSERILQGLEFPGGTSLRNLANDIKITRESSGEGQGDSEYLTVVIDS
jgi:serine/threonine-protein kinase RsbW